MPRITRGRAARNIFDVARENRKKMTPAEETLWEALRNRRLSGLKFRKQHPLGHFVLDFFCVEQMLVIEVDGDIHDFPENKELDRERTTQLNEKGIRVLRFPNNDVMFKLEGVLRKYWPLFNKTP